MIASTTQVEPVGNRRPNAYSGFAAAPRRTHAAERLRSIGAVVLAVVGLFASGCDNDRTRGVAVDNNTDLELHFVVTLENGPYALVERAHPHHSALVIPASILPAGGCTAGGMIALADDGHEVARHDAPLCMNDRWVIDVSQNSTQTSPTASP